MSVSSGLGSAYAWARMRAAAPANTIGLFADVNGEDPDNYRFLDEVHRAVGGTLVTLGNDGRTIWDVFHERRFLGNTRVDLCSRILKREAILGWLTEHCDPADTTVVLGIDWTEAHRFERARERWAADGWHVVAPMVGLELDKSDAERWLANIGVARPRLYDLGFAHANCGGGCVKAGVAQFRHLHRVLPDRFAEWEAHEEALRDELGDVSILRDRTDGDTKPLTLRHLREQLERQPSLFADGDWGACGCFTDTDES